MLPTAAAGLGLVRDVAEHFDLLGGPHELEAGLAAGPHLLDGVQPDLELFELDTYVCVLGIKLVVAVYLVGETPVIVSNKGIMEQSEINGGAHHEEAEPRWDRYCGLGLAFLVVLVIGLCIEVNNVGA